MLLVKKQFNIMRIFFKDLQIGDEIIISSNSNLKYIKVEQINKKSATCSIQRFVTRSAYRYKYDTLQPDVSKHNSKYYLQDDGDYRDIWLVKRELKDNLYG